MRQAELTAEIEAVAEQSYNQLDGEWREWLEVAKRYEHKVRAQDRLDVRHDIMLELYKARQRDGKPLPLLRAYRIASLTVALYWRAQGKGQTRVCVIDGIAKRPHCRDCHEKPKHGRCPWIALRPPLSLEAEVEDAEGNITTLADTVADDNALDLDGWRNPSVWLLGYPARLAAIAVKVRNGEALSAKDRMYLMRWRKSEQKKLI